MDNCPICVEELNVIKSFVCIKCKKIICDTCTNELKSDECPFCRKKGILFNSLKFKLFRKKNRNSFSLNSFLHLCKGVNMNMESKLLFFIKTLSVIELLWTIYLLNSLFAYDMKKLKMNYFHGVIKCNKYITSLIFDNPHYFSVV